VLGHGTVGSAFAGLLEERADAIEAEVGRRPEISGVLTRSRGAFDDIVERSDLIVELMGGVEPTREYVLRALDAGRHVVTANSTARRCSTPRGAVACRCASRGPWRAWCRRFA